MKKLIYIAALAGTFALTGCEDFLTPENKSAVTDKDYFTSKTGFSSIVSDVYSTLGTRGSNKMFNASNVTAYFSAGTDLYMDARNPCNDAIHCWQNLNPENSVPEEFYKNAYDAIRKCYTIDYYAPDAACPEEDKARMIDECHTVACFYYYLLVNKFGGVPLVTEYAASAILGYPRATAADVYGYIITELERIVANNALVPSTAEVGGGQISMEAAKAILAKTYLSAAWDLNKPEYFEKAAKWADEVIDNRQLTTTPFAELWAADRSGDDNAEFIWDVEYDYDTTSDKNGGNDWQSFFSNYYGGNSDGMKHGNSNYIPTLHALKYFEKGDLRYDATFMKELYIQKNPWDAEKDDYIAPQMFTIGGNYFGKYDGTGEYVGIYYPAWYETDAEVQDWVNADKAHREHAMIASIDVAGTTYDVETFDKKYKEKKVDYETEARNLSYSNAPCRKFDDSENPNFNGGYSFRDLHIIMLPEMFFVAAEAYHKSGNDTKATDYLNAVRKRAGLDPITLADVKIDGLATPDMIDWILKESACEMFGNGYRSIDLRRTGKLVEYNNLWNPQLRGNAANAIGERLLWPIPQAAIDANKSLTEADQNPGY